MRCARTILPVVLFASLIACGRTDTADHANEPAGNEASSRETPSSPSEAMPSPSASGLQATADLEPTEGNHVKGTVTFSQEKDVVVVRAEITGLTPGKHGFHVHEKGDCSAPDGSSAGGHFNPTNKQHGARTSADRHVGDLGNVEADADGKATLVWRDPVMRLDGPDSIIGKAVIVHAGEDDLKTQPSGNAGARVACGVIQQVENKRSE